MVKVNKKNKVTNKTFEFLSIFSMIFGLMVGSGIYLKNSTEPGGVLERAQLNPYVAISIWIFIGFLCTIMMLVFIEVASSTQKGEHSTVQTWASKFFNRRTGSLYSIFFIIMYIPVMTTIGGLFLIKTLLGSIATFYDKLYGKDYFINNILSNNEQVILQICLGTLIIVLFQVLNALSKKPGYIIQTIVTFLKFVPLLAIIVAGFILVTQDGNTNSFTDGSGKTGLKSLMLTTIPVLFAFDGFIYGTSLKKDIEHKEVVAPAMLVGIIAVTLFYVFLTVCLFMGTNTGDVFKLFDKLFKDIPVMSLLFKIVIVFTLISVVNGYTSLMPKIVQSAIEEKFIYTKNDSSKFSYKKSAFIGAIATLILHFAFIGISLLSTMNNEEGLEPFYVANLVSDSNTVLVFVIYLTIIIGAVINRKTKKTKVENVKGGFVVGIIASVILSILLAYIYFDFLIMNFINAIKEKDIKIFISPIVFFILIISITATWLINDKKIKKSIINSEVKSNELTK